MTTSTEGRQAGEIILGAPLAILPECLRGPLAIAGSLLEPTIARFCAELISAGVRHLEPHFYLCDEWGVPWADDDGTPFEPPFRSIAIPFYLARTDLTALQRQCHELVEGETPEDVLRYLRHETGHVLNYAYRLYEAAEWTRLFGNYWLPYPEDDYPCDESSRDFVRNLPTPPCYAQKHPDEDWAETFAVWMTGERAWRSEYKDWPKALEKLEYCGRVIAGLDRLGRPDTGFVADSEVYHIPEDYFTDVSAPPTGLSPASNPPEAA
jgi:hypothetical protein